MHPAPVTALRAPWLENLMLTGSQHKPVQVCTPPPVTALRAPWPENLMLTGSQHSPVPVCTAHRPPLPGGSGPLPPARGVHPAPEWEWATPPREGVVHSYPELSPGAIAQNYRELSPGSVARSCRPELSGYIAEKANSPLFLAPGSVTAIAEKANSSLFLQYLPIARAPKARSEAHYFGPKGTL